MDAWKQLGITATPNRLEIKRQYTAQLKLIDPQNIAAQYQELTSAYRQALSEARFQQLDGAAATANNSEAVRSEPVVPDFGAVHDHEQLAGVLEALYVDLELRSEPKAWVGTFSQVFQQPLSAELSQQFEMHILEFVTRNNLLPASVLSAVLSFFFVAETFDKFVGSELENPLRYLFGVIQTNRYRMDESGLDPADIGSHIQQWKARRYLEDQWLFAKCDIDELLGRYAEHFNVQEHPDLTNFVARRCLDEDRHDLVEQLLPMSLSEHISAENWLLVGHSLLTQKQYDKALRAYQLTQLQLPEASRQLCEQNIAHCFYQLGHYEVAAALYSECLLACPHDFAIRQRCYDACNRLIQNLRQQGIAGREYEIAELMYENGRYAEAAELLAPQADRWLAESDTLYGRCVGKSGEHQQAGELAIAMYEQAKAAGTDATSLIFDYVLNFGDRYYYSQVITLCANELESLEQVARSDSEYAFAMNQVYTRLIQSQKLAGDAARPFKLKATEFIDMAVQAQPLNARYNYERALLKFEHGDYQAAAESGFVAVPAYRSNYNLRHYLAFALFELADYPAAIPNLEFYLGMEDLEDQQRLDAGTRLFIAKGACGEIQEVLDIYKEHYRNHPEYRDALQTALPLMAKYLVAAKPELDVELLQELFVVINPFYAKTREMAADLAVLFLLAVELAEGETGDGYDVEYYREMYQTKCSGLHEHSLNLNLDELMAELKGDQNARS